MPEPNPLRKVRPRATVRIDAYRVIREAVEAGSAYGWRRAFKYTDEPDDDLAIETIATAVMNELAEVLIYDEGGDRIG